MQCTIKNDISAEGVGIHYGKLAFLTLKPAPVNTGIVFLRTDITNKNNRIPAIYKNIDSISLSTKIKNTDGASVSTIEHLMAAIATFGISNLIIEINNEEVPIMEGGSEDFCFLIECAGIDFQNEKKQKLQLKNEIKVGNADAYIIARPSSHTIVNFTAIYNSKAIGEQTFSFNIQNSSFMKEIASSRTNANVAEIEALHKAGMGLGGSLKNTLVYDADKIINESYLGSKTDFVKHKILDFIGDVSLAGNEIIADFTCFKSGHKLNHLLLKEVFLNDSNYEVI